MLSLGITASLTPSAAAANASSADTGSSPASAAIVSPLLKFFEFGNSIGFPLACSDAGSIVSIIGSQSGAAKVSSPLVTELDLECAQVSSAGGKYLQQAMTESQSLALLNPLVNPLIQDLSGALVTVGTQDGPSLSPFGPTVAGLGGTVAFFEGS
jgi:hypothetical protein